MNHRYQITDPYPFIEDPLFTVAGSLIGIGWSFAFIRYWKTPAFFPAPTRLLSARLLGIVTASVVGSMVIIFRSSALLSFIQRCFSGKLQSLSVKDASAAVTDLPPAAPFLSVKETTVLAGQAGQQFNRTSRLDAN